MANTLNCWRSGSLEYNVNCFRDIVTCHLLPSEIPKCTLTRIQCGMLLWISVTTTVDQIDVISTFDVIVSCVNEIFGKMKFLVKFIEKCWNQWNKKFFALRSNRFLSVLIPLDSLAKMSQIVYIHFIKWWWIKHVKWSTWVQFFNGNLTSNQNKTG